MNPFPSTINWNQDLYIGMTVRGTTSCSFGSCLPNDAEMTPRLKLTAVPFAFSAGNLANISVGGFSDTLVFQGASVQNQTIQIPDDPTHSTDSVCLQSLANCGTAGASIVGTYSSTNHYSDGASISGSTITLGSADATHPGLIDTSAQSLAGAKTFTALLTGQLGATISGGVTSINAGSNFATSINTGASNALVSIGGGSGTFALDTTNIDISAAGAITGATGITIASGNFDQSASSGTFATGTGAISLNGAATAKAGVTVANTGSLATQKGTDYSTTGSQNDVNFGAASLYRLTGASAQTITGIAGGVDGRVLTLVNAGSNAATIVDQSSVAASSSLAANRIVTRHWPRYNAAGWCEHYSYI